MARLDAAAALHGAQMAGDTKVVVQAYPDADANALRGLADDLRGMTGRFVLVTAGGADGTPSLLVAASRDLAGDGSANLERGTRGAPIIVVGEADGRPFSAVGQ